MKFTAKPILIAKLFIISGILAACSSLPKTGGGTGGGASTFTIGGTVTGLTGTGLVLQDNGADNLAVTGNGKFTFKIAVAAQYAVTVLTQPTNPAELCTVTAGSGSALANVTAVQVTCGPPPPPVTIGGTVSGMAGTGLVLQDNGGDNLSITANGPFTFATKVASGAAFGVTVLTQPSNPLQNCTVTGGSGTTGTNNITNVQVACTTGKVTIGGTVTGLSGTGLVLQNNGGDNLTITKNGTFTFATSVTAGTMYAVTVLTQPSSPSQDCTVASGSGTANSNVGTVVITCSAGTISIGGSVSGLDGTGLVLQNNAGDNLTVSKNGTFTFATLVSSGSTYNVTILTQPSGPAQTCTVSNQSGTATANVTTIQVTCPAVFFTVGGQVVGLLGNGGNMTLQNNGADNLPVSGNGAFTFVTKIAYGSQYDVSLFIAPSTQPQYCVMWNYTGTNVISNITTVVADCGHNDWTWMDGGSTSNAIGSNSIPSGTTFNTSTPGGRKYPATWVDNSGNLWLFGGQGYDLTATPQTIFLNDLWEYTNTGLANYGGGFNSIWQQKQANLASGPSARTGAITWTDAAGLLWLYGGQDGGTNFLDDMWNYNTATKTWTQVFVGAPNQNGNYGTQGTTVAGHFPGGRWGATAHKDSAGNLWLFGGFGYGDNTSATPGLLNDLWKFDGTNWTWMSGLSTTNADGVYGTQGQAGPLNVPGGREASVSWVDASGNFWLFGGYNLSAMGQPNAFNDLWEYSAGQWTWVSGSSAVNQLGNYGVQGTAASTNVPGARWSPAAWIDAAGRLWLFGGEGFDATANGTLGDLWYFNAGQWTWVKGPSSVSQPGVYGLPPGNFMYPHYTSNPGTRWGSGYWTDQSGQFWMFGGEGFDSTATSGGTGSLNDLWRYLPYP